MGTKYPLGVEAGDLKRPDWESKDHIDWKELEAMGLQSAQIEMLRTERFGWCIPTLLIGKARRGSGYADRTYAISEGGQLCRIGKGPHIKEQVTVYLTKKNIKRLQPLLDLLRKGAEGANDARDRISTRRLQGSLRRRSIW